VIVNKENQLLGSILLGIVIVVETAAPQSPTMKYCWQQARNQLGTTRGAKSFLRGIQNF